MLKINNSEIIHEIGAEIKYYFTIISFVKNVKKINLNYIFDKSNHYNIKKHFHNLPQKPKRKFKKIGQNDLSCEICNLHVLVMSH